MQTEAPPPGVTSFSHTADVGMAVTAATLPELFTRAARGMFWMIQGDAPSGALSAAPPVAVRSISLAAPDLSALLREWLRELLYWHESEGLSFGEARFSTLEDVRLVADVGLVREPSEPIREIKGVTLHGLIAERRGPDWAARVIFDV